MVDIYITEEERRLAKNRQQREFKARNKEAVKAYSKRYREENKTEIKSSSLRCWNAKPIEERRALGKVKYEKEKARADAERTEFLH